MRQRTGYAAALWLLAGAAAAQDRPALGLPADCVPNQTCFIQQYVDSDPGPGQRDHTCGRLSYDGHKGTDFGLASLAAMRGGVAVIAAAPGIVRGIRDGMDDRYFTDDMATTLEGRDCGNGVVIDHGDGWETQYCHMRKGSVSVRSGDAVTRGQPLGLIGLSGRTQFPHVHLSLRHDGAVVDPFDPDGVITCGAPSTDTMWIDAPAYTPGGLLSAGFSDSVPDYDTVRDGAAHSADLPRNAGALVAWGYAFGGQKGDILRIAIRDATGAQIFSHDSTLDKAQAQYFRAAGRRPGAGGWQPGMHQAEITLIRDGATLDQTTTSVNIR